MTIDMDGTNYQDLANTKSGNNTTYPDATGFALTAAQPERPRFGEGQLG